jgi:hypothetical protein
MVKFPPLLRNYSQKNELEQQGADLFLRNVFDVDDLMRIDEMERIYQHLRLTDIQDKPKLFSTFMLSLLAEIYQQMPEKEMQINPN